MDDYTVTITITVEKSTGNYRWDRSDAVKREFEIRGPLASFTSLALGKSINALWRATLDDASKAQAVEASQ